MSAPLYTTDDFHPGDPVEVVYDGYTVHATVVESPEIGLYGPMRHWLKVRQNSEYLDVPEEDRPVFGALVEFTVKAGDELPPEPFSIEGFKRSMRA